MGSYFIENFVVGGIVVVYYVVGYIVVGCIVVVCIVVVGDCVVGYFIGYCTVGYCVGCVTVVGYCLVEHQMVLYCRGRVLVRGTCTGSGNCSSRHITGLGLGRLLVSGKVGHGTVLSRSNRSGVFHLGWCCVEQSWGAALRRNITSFYATKKLITSPIWRRFMLVNCSMNVDAERTTIFAMHIGSASSG